MILVNHRFTEVIYRNLLKVCSVKKKQRNKISIINCISYNYEY